MYAACHLLTFWWHSGMPHHPYHSSLLIYSLICLDGSGRRGTGMKGVEGEKEKRGGGGGVWERRTEREVVNRVWWNRFARCLTVREFLISHWAPGESNDTSTVKPHAALPEEMQWYELQHILFTVMTNPPPATDKGLEITALRKKVPLSTLKSNEMFVYFVECY